MSRPSKILCVDDDPDVRAIAVLALASLGGFEARGVASCAEALGALAEWAPDVILLDVMMPGTDGVATLRAVRAAGYVTPAIFMTARTRQEDRANLVAEGAIGVIAKPFDARSLPTNVIAIWSQHRD